MAIVLCSSEDSRDNEGENKSFKSAKLLADAGVERVPNKYILPPSDRPNIKEFFNQEQCLPLVDLSDLEGSRRGEVLKVIGHACAERGFFQIINHGISSELVSKMMKVATQFFDLPLKAKLQYMSPDFTRPIRYGTSFNQQKDPVFCWRDFLKHNCHPLSETVHLWPSDPPEYRQVVASYAEEVKLLAAKLMVAIMETLALPSQYLQNSFENGSQIMVLNCYPPCPEPDLTLGIPPHSDYGCITILLEDAVGGLQVQHEGEWIPVKPWPNSFVVNLGDHLEILSNGRYKSVMHRVVVNSDISRVSVATLMSLPFEAKISPAAELIDDEHPKMYSDTDFAAFLKSMSTDDVKEKRFLDSLRLEENKPK